MGNFNEIVPRRINILPARVATLVEAQTAPVPFDKYYTLKPTRRIGKLNNYFVLPSYFIPSANVNYMGQLLFQFNVTAPIPFYILNPIIDGDGAFTCTLCIKWRIGTTVFRYLIHGNQIQYDNVHGYAFNISSFPRYRNQLIPQQCVFEVWSAPITIFAPLNYGLQVPFKVLTSIVTDPSTPDDIEMDLPFSGPFNRETVAFPLTLPLNNPWPHTVWNSN